MDVNNKLSSRELELIKRGYLIDDVINLCNYTNEEMDDIVDAIMARITLGCKKVSNPTCIFIGGQPGVGKSSAAIKIQQNNPENGVVEIGIDNYRMYHPNYLKMEEAIRKHWENRIQTDNDTPGNDIADFTHSFAGKITDLLIEKLSVLEDDKWYNILFEWGMRTSEGPLKTMKNLKELGYKNIVNFVVVHKDISLEACKLRADIMNDGNHIIRRVPNSFHELCVNTLPDSCNEIFKCGYLDEHIIDNFVITTRDSNIVWNSNNYKKLPGEVLNEYLNNYLLSINFTNDVELAKKAFSNESVGLKKNDDIERLKLLKEKIAELINDNPAPIMKK